MDSYVMYHCHTEYSLLDSCTGYQEYIDLAVKNGMKGIAFSEHGKPLNWCEKWNACKKAGIKFIHAVEIYLTERLEPKVRDNYHTVLIARNSAGVKELNSLIKKSTDDEHTYYVNRISFDEFLNLSDDIIATSACLASPLNKLPETHEMYEALVKRYDFLEVQPHIHEEQKEFNKRLLELSKKYNKPLIAGTDTHSSTSYKAECRSVLLSAKHKSYGDEDAFDLRFKTYDELVDMFEKQGVLPSCEYIQAIENTNKLCDMVDEIELDTSIKYPILHGSREADAVHFTDTVYRKFEEKVSKGIIPKEQVQNFEEAIEEEMRVFKKLNMTGFMLSMSELISWCKEQGMAIGPARGSVGGSRIAYVMDIIDLNPETWKTVFSRFANEDREEIGDIDIDCIESDRPKIFQHVISRFGEDKTARVASFGTIKEKGVIDDVGRHLAKKWVEENGASEDNPWSLQNISRIKDEFESNPEGTKQKYPELFYYFDGLLGTKITQSVHPAGMVISPITLHDNYGVFHKDGELCLLLDMENIHDFTGLAKYDFLLLKTVQVINDTCKYAGISYPKSHEIDWNDQKVWEDMITNPTAVFQFESVFAFDSLKKFKPRNLFDMSIVTACIRPSGTSYRNDLLNKKVHKNPSEIIDELLKDNFGYLIYQEDTIKFLQQICGLSGSEADNIRRAIGRKQKDRLDAAMPSILEGYCNKSSLPREEAEKEAKEFLQVIEDSASYQFGYNHSIAYCMLGYLCAYYRYYYPLEFITAFLNNAANDEDVRNGTVYANKKGISITMPKWGISKDEYFFDKEKNIISKGLSSIKYMSKAIAEELYNASKQGMYGSFIDVLDSAINTVHIDSRQLDILIRIDFFSDFGNQKELRTISDLYMDVFKKGTAKQVSRSKIEDDDLRGVIEKYSTGTTKTGGIAKSYTILDIWSAMYEAEQVILSREMEDYTAQQKAINFNNAVGYVGYVSGKEEDRSSLQVADVYRLKSRAGRYFGYAITTKSIGSGIETRFSVSNPMYDRVPVKKGDIIKCKRWHRDGKYFCMDEYIKLN